MSRPNIVMIWTDEQRADSMACYGNTHVQTPNLNRLADQSVVFEHAYCTQPLCTPSRASILTGLWPHQHRCIRNNEPLSPSVPTLAEMLPSEYRCAYYGKWHLGDEVIAQRGFSEWCSIEDNYRPYYSDPKHLEIFSDYHHFLVRNGFAPDSRAADGARVFGRSTAAVMAERYTKAAFLGREAARFIREQSSSQPFFLSVNMLEPHMPFVGPLNDMYDPDELPVGPTFAKKPPADASWRNRFLADRYESNGHGGFSLRTEADWRRLRANYYGLVSLVDSAVGDILDALESSGRNEDTIVVYTSDHGEMMGDHGLLGKSVLYEESVRIPLLMQVPGVSPRTVSGRISQIDLAPTLLELAETPPPQRLSGTSRADTVRSTKADLHENDVFVEWNPSLATDEGEETGRDADTVRLGRQSWQSIISASGWKLNLSQDDRCELFDLNSDPNEETNLYDDPQQQHTVEELSERIRRHRSPS